MTTDDGDPTLRLHARRLPPVLARLAARPLADARRADLRAARAVGTGPDDVAGEVAAVIRACLVYRLLPGR